MWKGPTLTHHCKTKCCFIIFISYCFFLVPHSYIFFALNYVILVLSRAVWHVVFQIQPWFTGKFWGLNFMALLVFSLHPSPLTYFFQQGKNYYNWQDFPYYGSRVRFRVLNPMRTSHIQRRHLSTGHIFSTQLLSTDGTSKWMKYWMPVMIMSYISYQIESDNSKSIRTIMEEKPEFHPLEDTFAAMKEKGQKSTSGLLFRLWWRDKVEPIGNYNYRTSINTVLWSQRTLRKCPSWVFLTFTLLSVS